MGSTGGWNRPASNQPTVKKGGAKAPTALKGIVAGLLAVVIGVVCWIVFGPSPEAAKPEAEKGRGRIKEVAPAVVSHAVSNEVPVREEKEERVDPNARPTKIGQKLNGYVMLADGSLHKVLGENHIKASDNKGWYAIFDHPAENIIAGVLALEPGQTIVGTPNYNGRFTASFLKSLTTPFFVSKDDTEEVKALKQAVKEAKIELKAAYDRGEDIEAIILKARADAQKLARVKQDVRREMLKGLRAAESAEDAEVTFEAANKYLESKGVAPLDDAPLTRIKLKMKDRNKEEGEIE